MHAKDLRLSEPGGRATLLRTFDAWISLIGPAGVAKAVVDRLNGAAKAALAAPEVEDVLAAQGVVAVGNAPETTAAFFRTELEKHAELIERSGATPD